MRKWAVIFLGFTALNSSAQKNTKLTTPVPCLLSNGKYIYTDRNLKPVNSTQYDIAYQFVEDMALVQINGKWGFINRQYKLVVPAIYDFANTFKDGAGIVGIKEKKGFVNKTGKLIIPIVHDVCGFFFESLARVSIGGKWGFIDKNGTIQIPPIYEYVLSFTEGLAAVKMNGKWGFIDKNGVLLIPAVYEDSEPFSEKIAAVKKDGKWGYFDKTQNWVIQNIFDDAYSFSEGLARVKQNGKWGFIDRTGQWVIKNIYEDAGNFSEGLSSVNISGKWGFINKEGLIVIPPYYDKAGNFLDGISWTELNENGKIIKFYIDKKGKQFRIKENNPVSEAEKPVIKEKQDVQQNPLKKITDEIEKNMVYVEGGSFNMGSDNGTDFEKPVHRVTLSSFYISKYEVTRKQWKAIMNEKEDTCGFRNLPAETAIDEISWNAANEFIKNLNNLTGKNYCLPTEAQWEYAAKGGNNYNTEYLYSGSNDLKRIAWTSDNNKWCDSFYKCEDKKLFPRGFPCAEEVGKLKPNQLGLYDMTGNVWEWCADRCDHDYYKKSIAVDPTGPTDPFYSERTLRGGSYATTDTTELRVTYRWCYYPHFGNSSFGFRLVLPGKMNSDNPVTKITNPVVQPAINDPIPYLKKNGSYIYVDWNMKPVITREFAEAGLFTDGLARVSDFDKYGEPGNTGFINRSGQEIIPLKYSSLESFSEELAAFSLPGKDGYINKQNQVVISLPYFCYSFKEGIAMVNDRSSHLGNVAFINKSGQLISPFYKVANYFCEGLAAVKQNEKWGFIDKTGQLVIPFTWDEVSLQGFQNGLCAVTRKVGQTSQSGFIDKTGKEVIPFLYEICSDFYSDGFAVVKKYGKWAVINRQGQMVKPYSDEYPAIFFDGLAEKEMNGKHGYINNKNEWVIQPKYDDVYPFKNGLALVTIGDWLDPDVKNFYIDKSGREFREK